MALFSFIYLNSFPDCENNDFPCPEGYWKCDDIRNHPRCLTMEQVCDGKKDCSYDGSDEKNCRKHQCLDGFIKCADFTCIQVLCHNPVPVLERRTPICCGIGEKDKLLFTS